MTERKEKEDGAARAGWESRVTPLDFFFPHQVESLQASGGKAEETGEDRGSREEAGMPSQVAPARNTQTVIADKRVQNEGSCLHPASCAFRRVFFYPRDGEQMAGTGAPRRAEGLLIPAFKSTCLNMSPSPSPRGFTFSTADALYLPLFPQPLLFIKFYMKSSAVNQCSERRRRGWREEGDVQRGSERL